MTLLCVLQLTHYDADEDGVTLHFDQGQSTVRAKVVVGADGYFSKIRRQCLNDGPPQFAVSFATVTCGKLLLGVHCNEMSATHV